jgi:two-component system OmpR family response regulator
MERKAKTILIAENDANNYRLLEEILVVLGFKVLQASNSKSIIEVMKSNGVDMLIIDMLIPGMQGLNTIKKLRAINSDVKIVGHVAPSQAGQYKDVGIDDFLAKPCNGKDLSALVEKYFLIKSG